jgi:flagellar basal-body rod protein FlgB
MDILNKAFALNENALRVRGQRMEVLAANIANADTPNFKARDLDFGEIFKNNLKDDSANIQTTNSRHYPTDMPVETNANSALKYRVPFNASLDNNTVELSVEQSNYGKAAAEYRASLAFFENSASQLKHALTSE